MKAKELFQQDFLHDKFTYELCRKVFNQGVNEGLWTPDQVLNPDLTSLVINLLCTKVPVCNPVLAGIICNSGMIKEVNEIKIGEFGLSKKDLFYFYGCISGLFDEKPLYSIPDNQDFDEFIKTLK